MYTQIIPADGWYFSYTDQTDEVFVYPLVAWGLTKDGTVIGLVAANVYNEPNTTLSLNSVPPVKGVYLKENQLDAFEQMAAQRR